MQGGVTTPEQLRRIADVAEKYDVPMVKLTGGQRIDLLGIKKEDLPAVWADLGMPSGLRVRQESSAPSRPASVRSSAGSASATPPSSGIEIETRLQGMECPAKMKLAVSGCPAQLRRVATSRTSASSPSRAAAGRSTSAARPARTSARATCWPPSTTPRRPSMLTGRFLQYYRENAKWLERTYAFVPRVGLDHIRAVVVEDSEGIAAGWTPRCRSTRTRYVDPWTQGAEPVTPGQFRTSLPLEVLPQVPADGPSSCWGCLVTAGHRRPDSSTARAGRPDPARRGPGLRASDGEQVAVFRLRDGSLRALSAVCPHKGGPIADGQIDDRIVLCPLHLNAFELDTGCSTTGQRRRSAATTSTVVDDRDHLIASTRSLKDSMTMTDTPYHVSTRTRRGRVRGHWIDDWRPEDGQFWETPGQGHRQAQPDLLRPQRAHRLLGLEPVVGAGAVPRPGLRLRPGPEVPAHRAADAGRGGAAAAVHLRRRRRSAAATGRSSARCCCSSRRS